MAEALVDSTIFKDIEAIGTRQTNSEWFVTFYKKPAHAAFLELGVITINGRNGYITTLDSATHRLQIHWAPYHLAMSGLHVKLAGALPQGATILSLGYERSQITELEHVATLVRFAVISFDGPASRLPHLLTVNEGEEQMEVLITTQGRDPICLKCRRVGHVRAWCTTPFCYMCKKSGHTPQECDGRTTSYAGAVRTTVPIDVDDPEEGEGLPPGQDAPQE